MRSAAETRPGWSCRAAWARGGSMCRWSSSLLVLLLVGLSGETGTAAIRTERDVTYVERQGEPLKADVYLPEGEGPFPTVLLVHGGAWASGDKWNVTLHATQLARAGYAVVAINYRHAPAHRFPAQLEDCAAALKWMVANSPHYGFDPRRFAGYGYSAGAHLVSLLAVNPSRQAPPDSAAAAKSKAAKVPDPAAAEPVRLKAIVAGGAPCDLQRVPSKSRALEYFLGATREENPEIYRRATPNSYVSPDDPPFFFYHGEADLLVPRGSADSLRADLCDAGVRAEMYIVPKQGHMGTFLDRTSVRKAIQFLDEVLAGPDASPPGPTAADRPKE